MFFRRLSAAWGLVGVVSLLGYAMGKLFHHAYALYGSDLTSVQWLVLIANMIFMAYSEGYRGFQKNFSPRVAARAKFLSEQADWFSGLLAPLFCLGYFGTTLKRQLSVFVLTLMIVVLVLVVAYLPQPWRGIVDAGVVIGLSWGIISLLIFSGMSFMNKGYAYSPELSAYYLKRVSVDKPA